MTGPVSYPVALQGGRECRRHVDHLRSHRANSDSMTPVCPREQVSSNVGLINGCCARRGGIPPVKWRPLADKSRTSTVRENKWTTNSLAAATYLQQCPAAYQT